MRKIYILLMAGLIFMVGCSDKIIMNDVIMTQKDDAMYLNLESNPNEIVTMNISSYPGDNYTLKVRSGRTFILNSKGVS